MIGYKNINFADSEERIKWKAVNRDSYETVAILTPPLNTLTVNSFSNISRRKYFSTYRYVEIFVLKSIYKI